MHDSVGISPYTVRPDGTIDSGFKRGAVSPSGRYAVLGGGITDGSDNELWFFVRK